MTAPAWARRVGSAPALCCAPPRAAGRPSARGPGSNVGGSGSAASGSRARRANGCHSAVLAGAFAARPPGPRGGAFHCFDIDRFLIECRRRAGLRRVRWPAPVIAGTGVPIGFPAPLGAWKCRRRMRRCVNDQLRPPEPFLGRGFRSRPGRPSSRTPGSTAAPRFTEDSPAHGAGRHGRLPGRPGWLRSPPRVGGARSRLASSASPPVRRRSWSPSSSRATSPPPGWW